MHSTDIQWSAILSWGYADNILRLKSKQSEPPINFIQCSQLHQVDAAQARLLKGNWFRFTSALGFDQSAARSLTFTSVNWSVSLSPR